jgi:hypothetical protein
VPAKGIRAIQGKKASNDLKTSLETMAMGHRQVQGSWGMKCEAYRTGATKAKSYSIFENA